MCVCVCVCVCACVDFLLLVVQYYNTINMQGLTQSVDVGGVRRLRKRLFFLYFHIMGLGEKERERSRDTEGSNMCGK